MRDMAQMAVRVGAELRREFKEKVHSEGLSVGLVIRNFMTQYLSYGDSTFVLVPAEMMGLLLNLFLESMTEEKAKALYDSFAGHEDRTGEGIAPAYMGAALYQLIRVAPEKSALAG